jgi:hypothetical protein
MVSTAPKKQKCDYISKAKETKRSKLRDTKYQVADNNNDEFLAKVSDLSSTDINFMSFHGTRTNQVIQEKHDFNMEYVNGNRDIVSILFFGLLICVDYSYISRKRIGKKKRYMYL